MLELKTEHVVEVLDVAFWVGFCVVEFKAWYHTRGEVTLLAFVGGRLTSIAFLPTADNAIWL